MTGRGLDQRFSFGNFIVGTANRLAAAAARRVAEAPGKAYNPLFIYGASGLGKTHLLVSIANHALTLQPTLNVVFDTLENSLQQLSEGDGEGEFSEVQLLLLDDVQYLGSARRAQDLLLPWWEDLLSRGVQIVLAADRPPTEIESLDQHLLSRFSAGLVADMAPPDYETRIELVRRKAADRGHEFAEGVAEAIARVAFGNVRELEGGINRVIASQELDGEPVRAEDVAALLGYAVEKVDSTEFDSFRSEVAGAVAEIATRMTPEQRLVDAILRFEGEGYRTYRLEVALRHPPSEREVMTLVEKFATDIEKLSSIMNEIRGLDSEAPELARSDLLRDPDRVLEAEALVAQVHERLRPLPEPGPGVGFGQVGLPETSPALSAARMVARRPGSRAAPLYIRGPSQSVRSVLLKALAREVRAEMPRLAIALVDASDLAREAAEAETSDRLDAWRGRYRRARLLIVDDVDRLEASAAVRDELFRLFDGVRRSGGQLVFGGESEPAELSGDDRLTALAAESDIADLEGEGVRQAEGPEIDPFGPDLRDTWFLNPEKALPRWPRVEDWLLTELD